MRTRATRQARSKRLPAASVSVAELKEYDSSETRTPCRRTEYRSTSTRPRSSTSRSSSRTACRAISRLSAPDSYPSLQVHEGAERGLLVLQGVGPDLPVDGPPVFFEEEAEEVLEPALPDEDVGLQVEEDVSRRRQREGSQAPPLAGRIQGDQLVADRAVPILLELQPRLRAQGLQGRGGDAGNSRPARRPSPERGERGHAGHTEAAGLQPRQPRHPGEVIVVAPPIGARLSTASG